MKVQGAGGKWWPKGSGVCKVVGGEIAEAVGYRSGECQPAYALLLL